MRLRSSLSELDSRGGFGRLIIGRLYVTKLMRSVTDATRHERSLAAVAFFGRIFFSGRDMPVR
jgi:hypothetical protein